MSRGRGRERERELLKIKIEKGWRILNERQPTLPHLHSHNGAVGSMTMEVLEQSQWHSFPPGADTKWLQVLIEVA